MEKHEYLLGQIRGYMFDLKITQKEMAEDLGIAQHNISDYFRGKVIPSLKRYCEMYDYVMKKKV